MVHCLPGKREVLSLIPSNHKKKKICSKISFRKQQHFWLLGRNSWPDIAETYLSTSSRLSTGDPSRSLSLRRSGVLTQKWSLPTVILKLWSIEESECRPGECLYKSKVSIWSTHLYSQTRSPYLLCNVSTRNRIFVRNYPPNKAFLKIIISLAIKAHTCNLSSNILFLLGMETETWIKSMLSEPTHF